MGESMSRTRNIIFILLFLLFATGCAHQRSNPEGGCPEEKEKVNVRAVAVKTAPFTYQVTLSFNVQMNGQYSFFPPRNANVTKTFWKDNRFHVVVKMKRETNSLSLVVNPKGFEDGFKTQCGTMLQTQAIIADVQ